MVYNFIKGNLTFNLLNFKSWAEFWFGQGENLIKGRLSTPVFATLHNQTARSI